jgi:Ca2+-binding EF-hand superfamily protein
MELKEGRKLTNEEADQMLKNMDSVDDGFPTTEGYMWDN